MASLHLPVPGFLNFHAENVATVFRDWKQQWIHYSRAVDLYGAPFSHLFTELKISPIEVHISAIQLQISTIHLKISSNQLEISTIKPI